MIEQHPSYIIPDWPAPSHVQALSTTRQYGYSQPPFESFNLAEHVQDDPEDVLKNRFKLIQECQLPQSPLWLNQVHGIDIVHHNQRTANAISPISADGSIANQAGYVCAVMCADCLPVLITDKKGTTVAAIHAGWRGLLGGILEQAIKQFSSPAQDTLVWLGPAIGPDAFEVSEQIRLDFIHANPDNESCFTQNKRQRWQADLYQLARIALTKQGVTDITGGDYCTLSQPDSFFSYRRDGGNTGRMASLIWIADK